MEGEPEVVVTLVEPLDVGVNPTTRLPEVARCPGKAGAMPSGPELGLLEEAVVGGADG